MTIETETNLAREAALKATLGALKDDTAAAQRLRVEYQEVLSRVRSGEQLADAPDNTLRRQVVAVARQAIADLRRVGTIGDDAYRLVEAELDALELSTGPFTPSES